MLLPHHRVNNENHLELGGIDALCLARDYGTPLYVMDEDLIRKNCRIYKNAIDEYFGGKGLIAYASKAFSCKYMYEIIKEEGLGTDVVSGSELFTSIKAGFPMDKVFFHGNNKTEQELLMALNENVGYIVVDNREELLLLNRLAEEKGKKAKILFRIKPGIEAHTHEFVQTGQIDSKFGVALETGEAFEIIKSAMAMKGVFISGIHCHIGSQIFDVDPFACAARVMAEFVVKLKNELSLEINVLNLGGGFGITYTEEDAAKSYDVYLLGVKNALNNIFTENGLKMPFIVFEPGRSIVGEAGTTLYTVGSVKHIPGVRTYVATDGGMADNPRFIMYNSKYTALLASDPLKQKEETVTIAGRCCESGDIIIKDILMPEIKKGDILAILSTGAYNYALSSNYNRLPRPPVIMVSMGVARIAVKGETYEDVMRNDL